MKHFTHSFKVNGMNDNFTFMADDKDKKEQVMKKIKNLIENISKKSKTGDELGNIEVNILGTEEWNTT